MIDGAKDTNKEVQTLPNFFISRKKLGGTKTLYAQKPLKDVFADQNYYFNLNIPGVNLIKALTPVFLIDVRKPNKLFWHINATFYN